MIKHLPFLISGTIIGMLLFQSICIVPAINRLIGTEQASMLLRHIWPHFFLIIALLSIASYLLIVKSHRQQVKPKYYALFSFLLMMICFFAVPTINHAKDVNNQALWTILHLGTMVFTLVALVLHTLTLFQWKFK